MAKFYSVSGSPTKIDTYDQAEEIAKRMLAQPDSYGRIKNTSVFIYEAIAEVKAPVPEAVVTKF